MDTNVQLRDEDAEKMVLGTIILQRNAFEEVRELLSEESFYNPFIRRYTRLFFKWCHLGTGLI